MNIHPIIVHFPIACLSIYSILQIISILRPSLAPKLFFSKMLLLFVGVLGTFGALQSGEGAESVVGKSVLVHTHEEFGEKTHIIYFLSLLIYICGSIASLYPNNNFATKITKIYSYINRFSILELVSIIGIVLLVITGALGGAISHGPDTDPIVRYIYDIFAS